MLEFKRGLDKEFVDALNALNKEGQWWNHIVHDKELHLGIRDNYLDVYYLGNRLLNIRLSKESKKLYAITHYKYLIHPKKKIAPPTFSADGMLSNFMFSELFINNLNDNDALDLIKRASKVHAGREKMGIQQILNSNYNIIDVEIALSKEKGVEKEGEFEAVEAPGKNFSAPRIDFVALQPNGDKLDLIFFEAKLFSNAEIRAEGDAQSKVIGQINNYKGLIERFKENIVDSYRRVCDNLLNLNGVLDGELPYTKKKKSLMQQVADGCPIEVSSDVRLVIFGFDDPQKG